MSRFDLWVRAVFVFFSISDKRKKKGRRCSGKADQLEHVMTIKAGVYLSWSEMLLAVLKLQACITGC